MTMLSSIVLILLGFVLLIKGADWMVDGASTLAKKHNISDLAIGLTIVAFGTSAPELVVNGVASLDGLSNIVFGNVIGSNNFNLFMTLGIVGLICPIAVQTSTVWKEIPISLLALILLFLLVTLDQDDKILSRMDGAILLICFALFIYYVYTQLKATKVVEDLTLGLPSNKMIWGLIVVGITGLIIGGKLVVDNAIQIASSLGVSQKTIGLTIIAAGTSLPELVTSVVAAVKKNSDIAIGNVVGSNIFNILLILSISALINPISYDIAFNVDIYLLGGGTLFLFLAMFTGTKKKLDRWEASLLLIVYVAYTIFLLREELS